MTNKMLLFKKMLFVAGENLICTTTTTTTRALPEALFRSFTVAAASQVDAASSRDFIKHKTTSTKTTTQEALSPNSKWKQQPPWLDEEQLPPAVMVNSRNVQQSDSSGSVQQSESISLWNSRLAAYVKAGQYRKTVECFQQMQQEGTIPDRFTFVRVLNACARLQALEEGKRIHTQVLQRNCECDIYVGNSLIDMYAKCRNIEDAWKVFNKMRTRNVVTWSTMIMGCVKCRQAHEALALFQQMQEEAAAAEGNVKPNSVTFVGVVNACASLAALEDGRRIHQQIIRSGCESNVFVGSSLIDMYVKCGSIEDAWRVFLRIPKPDLVCWNSVILGLVRCGQGEKALEAFQQMQCKGGVQPAPVTFVGALNTCASLDALEAGRRLHTQVIKNGFQSSLVVGNSLIDMYAKCGSIADAWRVFTRMPAWDVVSWNTMILGCVNCGQGKKALELYQQMQSEERIQPDSVTFVGAFNACASLGALDQGRHVHMQVIQSGCESDVFVGSSLLNMYAKCGSIEDAREVFDRMPARDVVAWNAMIVGYVKCGLEHKALAQQMQQEDVEPNPVTFVWILNACASVAALEEGRCVEEQIIRSGYHSDVFLSTSLIDMYAKCGSINNAWRVFNKMPLRTVAAWNTMILSLVRCGKGEMALELFQRMQQQEERLEPDPVTFVAGLNTCASIAALEEGRSIEKQIIRRGCESNIFVGNSLVDMYAKCGSLEDARRVFSSMPTLDVISWTALLRGYGMHGHGKEALRHFERMCEEGIAIDTVTFVCLLSACNRADLVHEGMHCLESMGFVYSISATVDHYACAVDLLGHAGHVHEAEDLMALISCQPSTSVCTALVGSCRNRQ